MDAFIKSREICGAGRTLVTSVCNEASGSTV